MRPPTRDAGLRVLMAIVLLSCGIFLLWKADVRADTGLPAGGQDFIAYWSAQDVAADGDDPYDEPTLRRSQRSIEGQDGRTEAQRFWNPPWALLVLLPVVALPFELATAAWLVLNLLGGIVAVVLAWRLLVEADQPPPLALGACLLFVPFIESVKLGQLTVLVTVLVLGGLLALETRKDALAGVLLGLVVIKPQAVLVVGAVLALHVIGTRRWTVLRAALATTTVLLVLSRLVHPSVWAGWSPLGGSPTHWHSATVAGWVRAWFHAGGGPPPDWPLIAVPLLGIAAVTPWAWRRRGEIQWRVVPTLLALSVCVAPFAWLADSMLALPVQVAAVGALVLRRPRGAVLVAAVLAVQAFALVVRSMPGVGQHHMVIVPLGLLAVSLAGLPRFAGARK